MAIYVDASFNPGKMLAMFHVLTIEDAINSFTLFSFLLLWACEFCRISTKDSRSAPVSKNKINANKSNDKCELR